MAATTDFTIVNCVEEGTDVNLNSIKTVKTITFETANTVDAADTLAITLADFGMTTVLGFIGSTHTTDNSVIIAEEPTSAVSAGVLTLTIPAGTDNDKRVIQVYYI